MFNRAFVAGQLAAFATLAAIMLAASLGSSLSTFGVEVCTPSEEVHLHIA